ncbi:MAG: MFS transporter, partial [Variovorax sp.]
NALALVGAALTALVASRLAHLPGIGALASGSSAASQAAQQVTTGGLQQALALLPGLDRAAVLQVYGDAFATLLLGLAAVTVLTAVVVFAFLRGEEQARGAEAALNCPAS